jgi:ribosomal protein L37AE/L43A
MIRARFRPDPCPRCKRNRWRTVLKKLAWRCRRCGYLRDARPASEPETEAA